MATGNSISRRKASSFRKKKRSKNSSEVRRRRKSRSRIRKSEKSKKLRRRDVSLSSSDDDTSGREDSVSASSSDSECDYRHRRARSRTRGNAKRGRKRARSHEGSRDSPRRRKKKWLKQSEDSKLKKKSQKKKRSNGRPRRDVSVDSARKGSSSSGESESERPRGRSGVRKKGKRISNKTNNERDRYRHRSRSVSSCSGCSNRSSYHSEEELPSVNHSRRLRSVVAIESRYDEAEERFQSKDEEKADIIQAYDDCPSCRSNDSYEGGRKESSHQTLVICEKNKLVDDGNVVQSKDDGLADSGQCDSAADAIRLTNKGFKGEVSTGIGHSEGDDLELILRQKALENLKKFRGVLVNEKATSDQKFENDNAVKQPSAANAEIEPNKEAGKRVAGAKQIVEMDMENAGTPTVDKISATYLQNGGQIPDGNRNQLESKAKQDADHTVLDVDNYSSEKIVAGKAMKANKNSITTVDNKSRLGTSTFINEYLGDHSNLKQVHPAHDSPNTKTNNIVNKIVPVPKCGNSLSTEVNEAHESGASEASSCLTPVTGEHGSNQPGDAAEGGSQFEQKTMTVMRGGELVQVSYKVYIPKKRPALARRQLQR